MLLMNGGLKARHRKLIACLAVLIMLFSSMGLASSGSVWGESVGGESAVWDGTSISEVNESDASGGIGLGYYCISTASQLAWLAQEVNSGNDFIGKTVLLLNDIDLGGHEWTPIGKGSFTLTDLSLGDDHYGETAVLNSSGHTTFEGLFDGGGHMISGLSISQGNGVALFGYLGATGKIQSLRVAGSVRGNHFVSGVAAISGGALEDITNQVVITAEGNFAGGIAAEAVGSINISNCHNRAYISNTSNTRSSGQIAGIIGRIDSNASAQITLCSNSGELSGYQYVGGIVGGSFGNVNVSYCYNTAKLTGVSFGKVYLGGIVGNLEGGTISYCYNTGDLHDEHWAAGHIRAIGGITGCEEDHSLGTAISNCYTTGTISVNTSNMAYGSNWIYMFGNISGGNSATGVNTMSYENCYYLEGRIAIAESEHESYKFWSDIYKANPLIWDTEYITSQTEAQMKSKEFLAGFSNEGYFVADEDNINGGYPVLYWQSGQSEPEPSWYSLSKAVIGSGTADVSFSTDSATAGTTITLSISGLAPDKMIREVNALDSSGRVTPVSSINENSSYTFIMPARNVSVTVSVENKVAPGARYLLTTPEDLDAIWSVAGDSTYAAGGKVTAGASVFMTVNKAAEACMTSFKGVQITTDSGNVDYETLSYNKDGQDSRVSGVYLFTMPAADVTVSLEMDYAELAVYTQDGPYGAQTLKKTYTRGDMLDLAEVSPLYYSGYYSETEAFIGKAEQAVTLTSLLADAGALLTEDSQLEVASSDGMNLYFSYDNLYGSQRYYYPNLITGKNAGEKAEGKIPVDMLLIIKGYFARAAEGSVDDYTCDTLHAYRFVFGQNEMEFNKGIPAVEYKAVDKMSKYVNKLVVINPSGSSSASGDVNAPVWDGYSLDVSWFDKNTYDTTDKYYITTPAQLAGLAAIVNGIYNSEINAFAGDTSSIAANWAEADGVDSNGNNTSVTNYCMGSYDFEGKTVYLTADIDMSGGNYMPIGGQYLMVKNNHLTNIGSSFNGTFDGQGHSLTIVCDRHCSEGPGEYYKAGSSVGLIGRLGVHDDDPADWRPLNPTVRKVAVYGSIHANRSVGGIVGRMGKTAANNTGNDKDGGIIEECANFASVSNTDTKGCGGIVGAGWSGGIVRNCYNAGDISSSYGNPTGGISGSNEIILENCYNIGTISAPQEGFAMAIGSNSGGAPYSSSVINCWYLQDSAPGGGYYDINKAYNDKELSVAEMKTDTFPVDLGTAFARDINKQNGGYPILAWQNTSLPSTYLLTLSGDNISSSPTAGNIAAGTEVTITVAPAAGKRVASFTVGGAEKKSELSGNKYSFTMPATATEVAVSYEDIKTEEAEQDVDIAITNEPVLITVPEGVTGAGITLTQNTALPSVRVESAQITMTISEGTQVSGSDSIKLPEVIPSSSVNVAVAQQVDLAIKVGSETGSITFSKPVMLVFKGQGSKSAGFIDNSGNFVAISKLTALTGLINDTDADAANTALTNAGVEAAALASGKDLIIWTKHFSEFIAYTPKSSSGGGGGGGGGGSGGSSAAPVTSAVDVSTLPATAPTPAAGTLSLSDIAGHWAEAQIGQLVNAGAISAYPNGSFKPDNKITRAEFAAVLLKALKLEGQSCQAFNDSLGHWAEASINSAAAHGIVSGYDAATFGPDRLISREQMAVMLVKAAQLGAGEGKNFTDGDQIADWAKAAVASASDKNIISGYPDGSFRPQANATRAEVAAVIIKIMN